MGRTAVLIQAFFLISFLEQILSVIWNLDLPFDEFDEKPLLSVKYYSIGAFTVAFERVWVKLSAVFMKFWCIVISLSLLAVCGSFFIS